jgi:hypothetical protein
MTFTRGDLKFWLALLLWMTLGAFLIASCGGGTSVQVAPTVAPTDYWSTDNGYLHRYIDTANGIVCYSSRLGGLSCLHLDEKDK